MPQQMYGGGDHSTSERGEVETRILVVSLIFTALTAPKRLLTFHFHVCPSLLAQSRGEYRRQSWAWAHFVMCKMIQIHGSIIMEIPVRDTLATCGKFWVKNVKDHCKLLAVLFGWRNGIDKEVIWLRLNSEKTVIRWTDKPGIWIMQHDCLPIPVFIFLETFASPFTNSPPLPPIFMIF